MGKLILWSRDNPFIVLLVIGAATAFFAYKGINVRYDSSTEGMMIEGDPERVFYQETIDTFGSDNITVVYVKDDEIFADPEKMTAVEEAFYGLQDVEGVARVDSLFNATNFKGEDGSLSTNPLLDYVPEEAGGLATVKEDALRSPLLNGLLVSPKGDGIAINVIADTDPDKKDEIVELSNNIDKVLDSTLKGKVDDYFQIGVPLLRTAISENIKSDQLTIVPMSALALLFLLVVGLRSINGATMPMITGGLTIIWATGFMYLVGIPINVLTVIVPAIVLVIGATEDMHIISEYFEGLEEGEDPPGAIEYMSKKIGLAVFLTALTTVIGFWTISINDITLLRQFGTVAAFALTVNFIITVTVIPVYLRYFGGKKSPFAGVHEEEAQAAASGSRGFYTRISDALISLTENHARAMGTFFFILAVVCVVGAFRIKVDNNFFGYFKPSSDVRVRSARLHDELTGAQSFYITLNAEEKGTFKKPDSLKRMLDVQNYIKSNNLFDSSLSLADHVALIHREMNDGDQSKFIIPEKASLIPQYLLFFQRSDIERYVTSDYKQANIVVRHNVNSSYDLNLSMVKLKDYMKTTFGDAFDYRVTGEGIIINQAADTMAEGQAKSLVLLLCIILIMISALFVNLKAGALALIPNGLPIVVLFGVMGWFDIPLNTGTCMIAAVAIGVAVDDTIHFMVRYNKEMQTLNDQLEAVKATIRAEVRPVLATSVALAVGFAILSISNFVPTIYFGALSAMVMVMAFVSDVMVTPILCVNTKLITLWDMLGLKLQDGVIKHSPLFQNMTPWQMKRIILLGHVKDYSNGEKIIAQGDEDRSMYLILNGQVRVEVEKPSGPPIVVDHFKPGDIFGEIALVNKVKRTASIVSEQSTSVLMIDWESLHLIKKIHPFISSRLFLNIARILGTRLSKDSAALSQAPEPPRVTA